MIASKDLLVKTRKVRPSEWGLMTKTSALLGTLLVLQHVVSLPRLIRMFDAKPDMRSRSGSDPERLEYLITGLVRAALRDRFCMKRSILLFHFLRKWGYDVRIFFGVVKDADVLKGHAWVSVEGAPFAEQSDPRETYKVTYAYPSVNPRK